jgi:hypothetical protein
MVAWRRTRVRVGVGVRGYMVEKGATRGNRGDKGRQK